MSNVNSAMVDLWEKNITSFLGNSGDIVTINYKPNRTGTDANFDDFFQEGMDSSDPSNIGSVTESTPTPVEVSGKVHLDLYGSMASSSEDIQQIGVGAFQQSDALFTCLISDAIIDNDKTRTVFDEADYVEIAKDGKRYNVIAQKTRGMGNVFILDVFMVLTNK